MSGYVIAEVLPPRGVCQLGSLQNVDDWAKMMFGASQAKDWPEDAFFEMNKESPKDVKLADALLNTNSAFVVSERFKDFLEKAGALKKGNEALPVTVVNHKGRKEKAPYFVIQQVGHQHCVNEKKTVGEKSSLEPITYIILQTLVLDESKIDGGLQIFRVDLCPNWVFFKRELAEKAAKEKFTGVKFEEIDGFSFV